MADIKNHWASEVGDRFFDSSKMSQSVYPEDFIPKGVIKIQVMFKVTNIDRTTKIHRHHTTAERLINGIDTFDYAASAKRNQDNEQSRR